MVQISLGRVIVLVGIIVATLLYFGINSGFLVADGAYCAKTCQERLKAEKEEPVVKSVKSSSPPKSCYGIYCDDKKSKPQKTVLNNFLIDRNFISIKVGMACQISGTCPSIKELADLFDNSDKYLSGDFYFDEEQNLWQRENPAVYKAFEYYKFMNLPWVVFVAPDDYTWDRSKQIIITSQLHYLDDHDLIKNRVRTEYIGLHVDGCRSATVGWQNNGSEILLDVLNHFYSKCKEPLQYDPEVEIFLNSTIFPDCDRECFEQRELFKMELKAEHLISAEKYEEEDEKKVFCYGIYCDKPSEEESTEKSYAEIRLERLQELADIQECKEFQIWDELKIDGKYRRLNYSCDDEDQRNEYLEIMRPKSPEEKEPIHEDIILCEQFKAYELKLEDRKGRAEIVTCDDEYERSEYLQEMAIRYPDGVP
jgi:hypothetical protein